MDYIMDRKDEEKQQAEIDEKYNKQLAEKIKADQKAKKATS